MPPGAMGVRNWSRWRSDVWGAAPLSLLLRGGRVETAAWRACLRAARRRPAESSDSASASGSLPCRRVWGRLAGHQ